MDEGHGERCVGDRPALYALAHAGIKPNEGAISRGQSFLIKTQLKDGSWPMTSRPTMPGGKG